MAVTQHVRPRVLDTWMALLAGDRVWHDRVEGPPAAREQGVAAAMLAALVVTVLVQWLAISARIDVPGSLTDHELDLVQLAAVGTLAAAVLAIRPLRLVLRRRGGPASFWWSVCWRSAAYLTLIAVTAAVLPRFRFLGAIPLGIVHGTDALLGLWALGLRPQPARWLKRLVFSPVHFGALGALIGTAAFDPDGVSTRTALGIYGAMWTGVVVAGATVLAIDKFDARVLEAQLADREELRARERELRLHWLHDDVLSEVRFAALRIESDGDVDAAKDELQDLDHRLRMRQLEESMRGGRPHLYEIIQPHLRRAQTLGVRIDRVPSLDRTSRRVDEATGQLVHRAVSNLMSNAMNAGATRVSLSITELADPPALEISLTDDAGGFSLDEVQPGRGLALLARDLGDGAVRRTDAPSGSTVSVRVPLDRSAPPAPSPRPAPRPAPSPSPRPREVPTS